MGYAQRVRQAATKVGGAREKSGFDNADVKGLRDSLHDDLQDPLALVGETDIVRNTRQHVAFEDAVDTLAKLFRGGFAKSGDLSSLALQIKAAGDAAAVNGNDDAKVATDMLVAWLLALEGQAAVASKGIGGAAKKATRRGVTTNLKRLGHVVLGGNDPSQVAKGGMAKAWDASFDAARLQVDAAEDADAALAGWAGMGDIQAIYAALLQANLPLEQLDLAGLAKQWLLRDVSRKAAAGNSMVEGARMGLEGNRLTGGDRAEHTSRGIMRSGRDSQAMGEVATQVDRMADLVAGGDLKGARAVAETVKKAMKHRKADALVKPVGVVVDALKAGDATQAAAAITQLGALVAQG